MEKRIKRKKKTADLRSGDFPLVMITTILVLFGLIMVFSASYYYSISQAGTPYSYLIKHGMWVVFGFVAMVFGASFDYRRYKKVAIPGLIISFVLLVLLFTPLGQTVKGATRWIGAGPVTIMPGELAKLAVILFTAWFLSKDTGRIKSVLHGILPLVIIAGVFGVLIMKQPNLSTAITVCGIIVSMMLVAGMKWRYCIGAVGAGALGIVAILVTKSGHWYSRLTSFTDPFADPLGDGYQVVQSLLALGSGGLFGVGLGKSVQKNLYLPEPQNDFIVAIIGEELGFVGLMLLLVAYCLFIWRGVHIAINAPDQFGMLLASGIVLMVAIQVILNIAVVTSSMPATGINLPFISYGGNGLLMFMFSVGVLINISRHEIRNTGVE